MQTTITIKKIYRKSGVNRKGKPFQLVQLIGNDEKFYSAFANKDESKNKAYASAIPLLQGQDVVLNYDDGDEPNHRKLLEVIYVIQQPDANPKSPKDEREGGKSGIPKSPSPSTVPTPKPLSDMDIETGLDYAIQVVTSKCRANGVAVNLDLITTCFDWKLEQAKQKFIVAHGVWVAKSKDEELKAKVREWKGVG